MDPNEIWDYTLFFIGSFEVTVGKLAGTLLLLAIVISSYYFLVIRLLSSYFDRENVERENRRKIRRIANICILLITAIGLILILQLDIEIYSVEEEDGGFSLKLSMLLEALLVLQIARFIDWLFSKVFISNYYKRWQDLSDRRMPYQKKPSTTRARRIVQPVVYILAILLIIESFGIDDTLWTYRVGEQVLSFTLSKVLIALAILLSARLISWIFTQIVLFGYYQRHRVNIGSQFAINQLLQYFIYVIAILIALESMDVKLTVLWGGAAALLVGIGLGLQQTFNDLISGIILLFERSVEVGDVVEVESLIGTVKKIGVRTSMVETRDNITVIVPNSKLITEKVINWSHFDNKARFTVGVGVAYGSDTALVKKLLLESARKNSHVLKHPEPFVRFIDFGNSSLDFQLHFWSHEFIRIEDVKSELRFDIDRLFRENNVTIPFPQRDVWFKNFRGDESG